ncbi:hypothetical protein JB92DRAFT_3178001 [Gautieria morchelliformis]|nr:hypothetical protein JB92DRAFT_3178001 [Gautieria morchelliformis]
MPHRAEIPPHPVVVVTGANSGVGFAICQRLIAQLSCPLPPDALPREQSHTAAPLYPVTPTKQLTLILACRNPKRAHAARRDLLTFADAEVSRQRKHAIDERHAEEFRRGLNIDCLSLDLTSVRSVFEFAKEARRQYPYVTHLILNAGVCASMGFDWPLLVRQLITEPVATVTCPRYVKQAVGSESPDGLGQVWQSNVFGHYCLARLMEPLLLANPYRDSRVVWVSSLDTEVLDPMDIQLRRAKASYQVSKYQVALICTVLSGMSAKKTVQDNQARINHILVHPGVCDTNVVGFFLVIFKLLAFYLARIMGSQNHPVKSFKGAIAPVHATLAPPAVLQEQRSGAPQKLGSRCTLFGREYVGIDPVLDWEENAEVASDLVGYCENLFQTFIKAHGETPPLSPTDSGIVLS